jgi:hypothetical protein
VKSDNEYVRVQSCKYFHNLAIFVNSWRTIVQKKETTQNLDIQHTKKHLFIHGRQPARNTAPVRTLLSNHLDLMLAGQEIRSGAP